MTNFKSGQKVKSKPVVKGPYHLTIRKLMDYGWINNGEACWGCKAKIKPGQLYGAGSKYNFCLNCIEENLGGS
jgi:hypothetical protein